MPQSRTLSLPLAILININIMLGTGIFINTAELAKRAGILGALGYVAVGLLMFPLIVSIARLLQLHPGGNFYTFGAKEINPFAGFMSAWCYFTGKLASSTLMVHVSMMIMQQLIPALASLPILALDACVLAVFIGLNMLNMRTGGIIQSAFMGLKAIPIFFAIIVGFFLLQGANFTAINYLWEGIPSVIPLVLYAAIGFEAACSISAHIEDPARNAPRAVYISFAIVITIAALYQFLFYGAVGQAIAHAADFRGTFPELLKLIIPGAAVAQRIVTGILYAAVASSALGGAYGIIFSNTWNLYALAKHGHTFAPSLFTQLNQHGIPWLCVLAEGVICATYLLISRGAQVPLQQISGLASVLAYTMSIIALAYARGKAPHINALLPIAGLTSCLILGASCVINLIFNGASSLITFAAFISLGIAMFVYTKRTSNSISAS